MSHSTTSVRPPGPKGHLLLGNLPEFASDLLGFFSNCARDYGDIVGLRLGSMPALFLNHPDFVEYVLVTNSRNFKKHTFFWRHVRGVFGNGLLTSEGDFWLRQRRLAQPAFHRERIAAYGDIMAALTNEMLEHWKEGQVSDVHREMMHVTSRIVAKCLFHADVESDMEEVGKAFDVAMREISIRFRRPVRIPDSIPLPGNLRYRKAVRRLEKLIYGIIRHRHVNNQDHGDLLSMLLNARDEDGSRMNDEQLRDEMITLFLAGHETTALALSWTWYLLSEHPEVEEKLLDELRSVLNGRTPNTGDLRSLRYTEKVVMESMRLYPPAYAFGRECLNDCEIGGYPVAKATTVFVSQWVLHRDPRYFEDPLRFYPGRWENDFIKRIPKFAYFPFGGGPRQCIGNAFAMMEAVLLLATIAQRFHLELVPGHPIAQMPSITLRPAFGVKMRITKRSI